MEIFHPFYSKSKNRTREQEIENLSSNDEGVMQSYIREANIKRKFVTTQESDPFS